MRKVLSCSAVLKCILCPGGLRVSGLVLILHIDIQFPQNCSLKLLPFLQCVFNFFFKKRKSSLCSCKALYQGFIFYFTDFCAGSILFSYDSVV